MARHASLLGSLAGLALFATACGDDGAEDDHNGSSSSDAGDDDDDDADDDDGPTAPMTMTDDDSDDTNPDTGDSSSSDGADTSTDDTADESSTTSTSACGVTPPDAWAAPEWETNAADALALRAALDGVVGQMRMAEQGAVVIDDPQTLVDLFEAGDPSVASITTAGYAPIVQQSFEEFVDLAAAGEQDLVGDGGEWTPGEAGGIYGTSDRGINEGGLEVRQLVDKGLFAGGALYNYAAGLTTGPIDEATIDALAASWGGNAMLDPEGELTDSANYTYQMGFHGDIATALVAAKAYAADAECEAERDEAIRSFFRTWELAMFARLVYYSNVALTTIEVATLDDDFAGALHELGEGFGLAYGFVGLEHPDAGPLAGEGRVATDEQIEAIATALGVDASDLGASTTGEWVGNYPGFVDAVADVEDVVMEAFSLGAADIDAFREPTAG